MNSVGDVGSLSNEIFGSTNELGTIIWDKRNPKGAATGVAYQHESIIVYAKNKNEFMKNPFMKKKEHAQTMLTLVQRLIKKEGRVTDNVREIYKKWIKDNGNILSGGESAYSEIDEYGNVYRCVSMAAPDNPDKRSHRPLIHPLTKKACPVPAKGWRFTDANMDKMLKEGKIAFGVDENVQPTQKYLLKDNMEEAVSSLLYFGGSADVLGLPFDTPKPLEVVKKIIYTLCKGNSESEIILDFFAGSSTVAHGVMELNYEDNAHRRFIMVQLPEDLDENIKKVKADKKREIQNAIEILDKLGKVHNLCEIGKERIRRAGEKIKAEAGDRAADLDIGFKVFKLDSSNLRKWNPQPDDLVMTLQQATDNFLPDRTEQDVLYEIMLKMGLELTCQIEEEQAAGETVYIIGGGALMICLGQNITTAVAEAVVKLHEEYESELWQVVFRDTGFASDMDKTNVKETLKAAGLDEDSFVCV